MDFEEAKRLLKEAVDEAETHGDILRIWIEKVYQQGGYDAKYIGMGSIAIDVPKADEK